MLEARIIPCLPVCPQCRWREDGQDRKKVEAAA
jgi:hypothetical protein